MACEIKFGDPLLDNYRGVETVKETRELIFEKINAIFKYYLKDHEKDIPEVKELDPAITYVILQLATLAEIPGFLNGSTVSKPGQPSRWNNEDGFMLSAKVQVLLLIHPEFSERKAIMRVAKKLFGNSVDEGVYRRYKEGLKNKWSYIFKVKYTVDHIKEINHYDDASEERKKYLIEFIKRHLNNLYNEQFENKSGKKMFKEDPNLLLKEVDLDHPVVHVTRFFFD